MTYEQDRTRQRLIAMKSLVLVLALLLAACSSGKHNAASRATTTTVPSTVQATTTTSQSTPTSRSAKDAALRLAHRMLADLVLPPGAQSSHETPPVLLATEQVDPGFGNLEDLHNLFSVRAAPTAVVAYLMARQPHGYTNGGTSSGTIQRVRLWGIVWTLAAMPINISVAELQVGIVGSQAGTSVVRVDAVVGWTAPRPANEYVYAQDHVVVVTFIPQVDGPVSRHRIITAPKQVAQLVTVFNQLRVMPPNARFGCPISSGSYRLAFSKSVGVTPDVIAEVGTCRFVNVTIDGRPAPGLDNGPRLVFSTAAAHALA